MTDTQRGVWLMILTMLIFAMQDGISRHLADEYNVIMVVMIRYWFFAAFVITVAARKAGSIRAAAKTSQPVLQISRGLLLAGEICIMVAGFVLLASPRGSPAASVPRCGSSLPSPFTMGAAPDSDERGEQALPSGDDPVPPTSAQPLAPTAPPASFSHCWSL